MEDADWHEAEGGHDLEDYGSPPTQRLHYLAKQSSSQKKKLPGGHFSKKHDKKKAKAKRRDAAREPKQLARAISRENDKITHRNRHQDRTLKELESMLRVVGLDSLNTRSDAAPRPPERFRHSSALPRSLSEISSAPDASNTAGLPSTSSWGSAAATSASGEVPQAAVGSEGGGVVAQGGTEQETGAADGTDAFHMPHSMATTKWADPWDTRPTTPPSSPIQQASSLFKEELPTTLCLSGGSEGSEAGEVVSARGGASDPGWESDHRAGIESGGEPAALPPRHRAEVAAGEGGAAAEAGEASAGGKGAEGAGAADGVQGDGWSGGLLSRLTGSISGVATEAKSLLHEVIDVVAPRAAPSAGKGRVGGAGGGEGAGVGAGARTMETAAGGGDPEGEAGLVASSDVGEIVGKFESVVATAAANAQTVLQSLPPKVDSLFRTLTVGDGGAGPGSTSTPAPTPAERAGQADGAHQGLGMEAGARRGSLPPRPAEDSHVRGPTADAHMRRTMTEPHLERRPFEGDGESASHMTPRGESPSSGSDAAGRSLDPRRAPMLASRVRSMSALPTREEMLGPEDLLRKRVEREQWMNDLDSFLEGAIGGDITEEDSAWVEARARLSGRSKEAEMMLVLDEREGVEEIMDDVLAVRLRPSGHGGTGVSDVREQLPAVASLLQHYDAALQLYPSEAALFDAHPRLESPAMSETVRMLRAWLAAAEEVQLLGHEAESEHVLDQGPEQQVAFLRRTVTRLREMRDEFGVQDVFARDREAAGGSTLAGLAQMVALLFWPTAAAVAIASLNGSARSAETGADMERYNIHHDPLGEDPTMQSTMPLRVPAQAATLVRSALEASVELVELQQASEVHDEDDEIVEIKIESALDTALRVWLRCLEEAATEASAVASDREAYWCWDDKGGGDEEGSLEWPSWSDITPAASTAASTYPPTGEPHAGANRVWKVAQLLRADLVLAVRVALHTPEGHILACRSLAQCVCTAMGAVPYTSLESAGRRDLREQLGDIELVFELAVLSLEVLAVWACWWVYKEEHAAAHVPPLQALAQANFEGAGHLLAAVRLARQHRQAFSEGGIPVGVRVAAAAGALIHASEYVEWSMKDGTIAEDGGVQLAEGVLGTVLMRLALHWASYTAACCSDSNTEALTGEEMHMQEMSASSCAHFVRDLYRSVEVQVHFDEMLRECTDAVINNILHLKRAQRSLSSAGFKRRTGSWGHGLEWQLGPG
eukprot:CAMPEP_0182864838 /NCGR_PEP_ID=MMETSP0034_2-20130328/7377_1 /TAXON_ID=156128 /ORGANISM="Nephroselmis pyriformis, Strain CCMP717" /LENGTH=1228 /DNA_ID=CAMNT_0024997109 /DNA_START=83 /DNA_END=3765 /DNA_ORIENTATION=-